MKCMKNALFGVSDFANIYARQREREGSVICLVGHNIKDKPGIMDIKQKCDQKQSMLKISLHAW